MAYEARPRDAKDGGFQVPVERARAYRLVAILLLLVPMASWLDSARPAASEPPATRQRVDRLGVLAGSVEISSELSSRKARLRLYSTPNSATPRRDPATEASEIDNVVVYLDSVSTIGRAPRPRPRPLVVAQVNETFVPHVLPVLKGDTVEFPNRDAIFHNVFSLSTACSFDLGRYPRPRSKSVRFERPGIVKIFCHIHSDMSSVIYVLDNPYFTIPDRDGGFRISGIPPGTYRLVVWHERARPASRSVRISDGDTTRVRVRIPLADVSS